MTKPTRKSSEGASRLADGYVHALVAADVLFGALVILMLVLTAIAWQKGRAPLSDFIAVAAYLAFNVALSELSRRLQRPFLVEGIRMAVGGTLTALFYVIMVGPLSPWWYGFMVLALGGPIGFGLLSQRPFWGRIAVLYYVSCFAIAEAFRPGTTDPYSFAIHTGVLITVGLMFAEIMSLLGRALQQEHKRSLEVKAARDALFAEMEVAQEIQTLLLPKSPKMGDSHVVGCMVPATEVGGDYYDLIETESGRTFLAIGDVSGHGVTSGLTMMMARTALVGAVESRPHASLPQLYRVLNRCVCESLKRMDLGLYMTFALLEYHGNGRYSAVGLHLPVLVFRHGSQVVDEIELQGSWLGVLPELECDNIPQVDFALERGDKLVLYTDGIVERFKGNEMYGFDRLKNTIRSSGEAGPDAIIAAVFESLRAFSSFQDDDVTMLVVDYSGTTRNVAAA